MPSAVVFWIVPPEPLLAPPALPMTVNGPAPVVLRLMRLAAPLELTLRNFTPAPPIVVLLMLTPVPVVVTIVLAVFEAVTVPPPVALKAVLEPVERVRLPEKLIVAPVLLVSEMPVPPLFVMAPVNDFVPTGGVAIETGR